MPSCTDVVELKLYPMNMAIRLFPIEMINALLDKDTGELMEYHHIMKHPKYHQLYGKFYAKELRRLAQEMLGQVEGTNTTFFIDKANIDVVRIWDSLGRNNDSSTSHQETISLEHI